MATEGVKQLKFANRQNVLITHHVVALVTAMGRIRAEYIGGTEDKQVVGDPPKQFWSYQFKILEEDIPSGYTFDAINESVFVEPYVEAWETDAPCDWLCFKAAEVEINDDPDYIIGVVEQETACEDDPTQFCQTRLTLDKLAEMVAPLMPPCECCDGEVPPTPCVTQNFSVMLFEDEPGEITDLVGADFFTVSGCETLEIHTGSISVAAPGQNDTLYTILVNDVEVGTGTLSAGDTEDSFTIVTALLSAGDVVTVSIDPQDGAPVGSGQNLYPVGPVSISLTGHCCN